MVAIGESGDAGLGHLQSLQRICQGGSPGRRQRAEMMVQFCIVAMFIGMYRGRGR